MTPIKEISYKGNQRKILLKQDTHYREFLYKTPIKDTYYTGHPLKRLIIQDTN